MQNFERLGEDLARRGKTDALRALSESADGARIASMLDQKALERAAATGDAQQLRAALGTVLQTEEGRRLAERIRKLMEG